MRAGDLWFRFRPAGAPGAASATGVPVDRDADLDAELRPLFAELARTERECSDIVECAALDAAERRSRAAEEARSLVRAAAERVDCERADAMVQVRRRGEQEAAATLAAAQDEVAQVRLRADEQMQPCLDLVIASVEALLDAMVADAADERRAHERRAGSP